MKRYLQISLLSALALSSFQSIASAHFPWLVRGDEGKLLYYFSDGVGDQLYKMPATISAGSIEELTLTGKVSPIATVEVDGEDFKGRKTEDSVDKDSTFIAKATFGMHRGGKLSYISMHRGTLLPKARQSLPDAKLLPEIFAEIVDTTTGIDVFATRSGKPLAKVGVTLYGEDGSTKAKGETDEEGKVSFGDDVLNQGIMAIMFGSTVEEKGEYDGKPYEKSSHYMTATFIAPSPEVPASLASLPEIPYGLTSFGAARTGDALYIYGGNTGTAHKYSDEVQSDKLLRLHLNQPEAQWEEIATGNRVQGLGMVAYQDDVIVLGGFTAMNTPDEPHNLQSQAAVRAYNTKTNKWKDLPSLPEPRSSHDAAILGSTIYVVGGWALAGKEESKWHSTAWAMDLSADSPSWKAIAEPPFTQRALALVAHDGKLFAIGGMGQKGGPSKRVWLFNPATDSWREIASLIGDKPMAGFGAAGWSVDGNLIVSTYEGDLERWNDADEKWQLLGRADTARFFHRLLPLAPKTLVAVGGANMGEGKFLELEPVVVK